MKLQKYSLLINEISSVIERGRTTAVRYVNTVLVSTYWLIGKRIVEFEQHGDLRAEYGKQLLLKLSVDLSQKFGKGFSRDNLESMRLFYIMTKEKISETLSRKLDFGKSETLSRISENSKTFHEIQKLFQLSWSHFRLLIRLDEQEKRDFYEAECIRGNWSVRQLDRQIQSMLYERTALSKRKLAVIEKAHKKQITLRPEDEIKDPYILEFLGLRDEYSEFQLEEALIKHLEHFLLELGIGFTFVARQKRITLEGSHYRLDLLLYHRILKCLVVIDLKIGEFTHADAGQMNLYLNYLKGKEKLEGENDPVGLILCTDKKKTVVEYAIGGMNNKIFASKYKLKLPNTMLLSQELEHEKQRLIEMKIVKTEENE